MSLLGKAEKGEGWLRLIAGGLMQVIPLLVACSAAFGRMPGSEPAALDIGRTLVMAAAWISMGVAVAELSFRATRQWQKKDDGDGSSSQAKE